MTRYLQRSHRTPLSLVVVNATSTVCPPGAYTNALTARVVDRALARRAVVFVAGLSTAAWNGAGGVVARGERKVDLLGERPLVPDGEASPGRTAARGTDSSCARRTRRVGRSSCRSAGKPAGRGRGATGGRRGRRAQRPRGRHGPPRRCCRPGRAGTPHRALGPYWVRGPGAPSSRYPASTPACQNASTCARSRARKPTWSPRVTGCSRSVGTMSQSSHSTSSAAAWLGSTPRTLRTVRYKRSEAARSETAMPTWSNTRPRLPLRARGTKGRDPVRLAFDRRTVGTIDVVIGVARVAVVPAALAAVGFAVRPIPSTGGKPGSATSSRTASPGSTGPTRTRGRMRPAATGRQVPGNAGGAPRSPDSPGARDGLLDRRLHGDAGGAVRGVSSPPTSARSR